MTSGEYCKRQTASRRKAADNQRSTGLSPFVAALICCAPHFVCFVVPLPLPYPHTPILKPKNAPTLELWDFYLGNPPEHGLYYLQNEQGKQETTI